MTGDSPSPYAPPASRLDTVSGDLELATGGQRFVNLIVDMVARLVLSFAVGVALGLAHVQPSLLAQFGIGLATGFSYYVGLEAWSGQTLGKLLTGTRAVRMDGSELALWKALQRTLARQIPFEPFSYLGAGERPAGWHDSLSKTRVIRVR